MSILSAIFVLPLLTLGIIFNALNNNILGIIFQSIFYPFIITYFILRAIYYKNNNEVINRISKAIMNLFITLIMIYFTLLIKETYKWIIFSSIILTNILLIVFNSTNILKITNHILNGLLLLTFIYILIILYNFNIISFLGSISIILFYVSNILEDILKTKNIMIASSISLIIFGIFYILI